MENQKIFTLCWGFEVQPIRSHHLRLHDGEEHNAEVTALFNAISEKRSDVLDDAAIHALEHAVNDSKAPELGLLRETIRKLIVCGHSKENNESGSDDPPSNASAAQSANIYFILCLLLFAFLV